MLSFLVALVLQQPPRTSIDVGNGDTIVYRTGALVRVVRRSEGNVRAIYNAPHRWVVLLLADPNAPGASPDGRVDISLLYGDVDGRWPLGDRWEGAATIDEYSVLGGPQRVGVGITTASGLVQLFSKSLPSSSAEWFRDPRAAAALMFQDANNRTSPARPSFDQAEQEATQFAEAVFRMREQRGQIPPEMSGTINTTMGAGASRPTAIGGAQPVRVGGNIRVPQKIVDVQPVYPALAQSARVQGVVIIEATIAPDGSVTDARVLRSIPLLDQAALDCVKQWKFEPTQINGTPVPVIMTVTVNFSMQ